MISLRRCSCSYFAVIRISLHKTLIFSFDSSSLPFCLLPSSPCLPSSPPLWPCVPPTVGLFSTWKSHIPKGMCGPSALCVVSQIDTHKWAQAHTQEQTHTNIHPHAHAPMFPTNTHSHTCVPTHSHTRSLSHSPCYFNLSPDSSRVPRPEEVARHSLSVPEQLDILVIQTQGLDSVVFVEGTFCFRSTDVYNHPPGVLSEEGSLFLSLW